MPNTANWPPAGTGKPVFQTAHDGKQALGKKQVVGGLNGRQTGGSHDAADFARSQQDGIGIHGRAAHDDAGGWIPRVVLKNRKDAARPEHPTGFLGHGALFRRGEMVKNTDRRDHVDAPLLEWQRRGVRLMPGLQAAALFQHFERWIATHRFAEAIAPQAEKLALAASHIEPPRLLRREPAPA